MSRVSRQSGTNVSYQSSFSAIKGNLIKFQRGKDYSNNKGYSQ